MSPDLRMLDILRRTSALLLEAEQAWSTRYQRAVADTDGPSQVVASTTLNDIVRARVELRELERAHGPVC